MTSYDVTCFHVKNCQTINQIICQMIDFYHCAGFLVIPLYIFMKAEIYLWIPTLVSIIVCKEFFSLENSVKALFLNFIIYIQSDS